MDGYAEVGQPHLAGRLNQHIGRFQVAVHDPGRVRGVQCLEQIPSYALSLGGRKHVCRQTLFQGLALDEAHHHP